MKRIFLAGAGRSSSVLIDYLSSESSSNGFLVVVGDSSLELARAKCVGKPGLEPIYFDVNDTAARESIISQSDVIISLLPPDMHHLLVADCITFGKHFLSASYVSQKVSELQQLAADSGSIVISECGLDPGIDHMSAMEIIDRLTNHGSIIESFRSYTGGLVAPESNDNPWGYKISWNPKNVILAGQSTASFISDGKQRHIPYSRIFSDIVQIDVEGIGPFDGYANRDSVSYESIYGLNGIPNLIRGTLRQRGYCRAWNVFVTLGLTDDHLRIKNSDSMTYAELVSSFLPSKCKGETLRDQVAFLCGLPADGEAISMVAWTGVLDDEPIGITNATPAQALQKLLEHKWTLKSDDKDMIVMFHEFVYELDGVRERLTSSLVVKGKDPIQTAMAKTVGLPLGITALKILDGSIQLGGGIYIPVIKEIYIPVLKELKAQGIEFIEKSDRL